MIYLLDSHVLIWAIYSPTRLSPHVLLLLQNPANILLVSDATLWELLNKVGRGKLRFTSDGISEVLKKIDALRVTYIPIERSHVFASAALPHHHSDPFDRMLIAQAMALSVPLVTADSAINAYGVNVIW